MNLQSEEARADIQRRLRRIEGQLRGLDGMLANGRSCREIVQQLNAANAALQGATHQVVRAYARECLSQSGPPDPARQAAMEELVDLLASAR